MDKLHAKVFWTPKGAVVGSANASSNGLPEDEGHLGTLIEAGVYLDDQRELEAIKKWFDELFQSASEITQADLKEAERERAARTGGRVSKRPFLSSLRSNPSEFTQQRIAFYLYEEYCSKAENQSVEKKIRDYPDKIRAAYGHTDLDRFCWYTFTKKPPQGFFLPDTVLIEGRYRRSGQNGSGRIDPKDFYVGKTFNFVVPWRIDVKRKVEWMLLVVDKRYVSGFNYTLTKNDKKVISDAADELWRIGKQGTENDRIISLADAKTILEKHWQD